MSKFETYVVVKSRGRGILLIQPHDWIQVKKKLRKPSEEITVADLQRFAQSELPTGREIVGVELAWYIFDKAGNSTEIGRKRISKSSARRKKKRSPSEGAKDLSLRS